MSAEVLIVIPAYNEEEALEACVTRLLETCSDVDVVIVNDGSEDRTQQIAEGLSRTEDRVTVVQLPMNSGIGTTVQTGLLYAQRHAYRFAIQYDGDGQHRPEYINELIKESKTKQLDMCVGSRFLDPDSAAFKSTFFRRLGIRFFAWLISLLAGTKVTDPTSGFRVYGRNAIEFFSKHYPDDYPEPEALFWCARNKLKVGELPVLMQERQGGSSSIRYLNTLYYMVKVTMAICIDRIRGRELVDQD